MIPKAVPSTTVSSIEYAMHTQHDGRMSLPVAPANYIYSHFKHISGVPAPEGVHGVTINKLKILDVLIEQLYQIKKQPETDSASSFSDGRIDALIEHYRSQIRQAQAASIVMPYKLHAAAPMGAIFNLIA